MTQITANRISSNAIRRTAVSHPARFSRYGASPLHTVASGLHGRHGETAWLDAHVHPGRIVVVSGLGGIGKTALVDCWTAAQRTIRPDLAVAVVLANGIVDDLPAAASSLANASEALLRIEDAHLLTPAACGALVRLSHLFPHVAVVMTARHAGLPATDTLHLGTLPPAQAAALFALSLPPDALAPAENYLESGAVDATGGWPLAIRLAAAQTRALEPASLGDAMLRHAFRLDGADQLMPDRATPVAEALAFAFARLPTGEALTLQVLARCEGEFERGLVAAVTHLLSARVEVDADPALVRLVQDGWLLPMTSSDGGIVRYSVLPAARAWLHLARVGLELDVSALAADASRRHHVATQARRLARELRDAGELREFGELAAARMVVRRVDAEVQREPETYGDLARDAAVLDARLHLDEGDAVLAEATIDRISGRWADVPEVSGLRGLVAVLRGESSAAETYLGSAASMDDRVEWQIWLGMLGLARGDTVALEEAHRTLLVVANGDASADDAARAWTFIAACWAAQGRRGVALALAEARARSGGVQYPLEAQLFSRFAECLGGDGSQSASGCRHFEDAAARLKQMEAPTFLARYFKSWALDYLGRRIEGAAAHNIFEIAKDGSWFRGTDGVVVELGRKPILRLLLLALAKHRKADPESPCSSIPIDQDVLIGIVWPGERIIPRAARSRLHVAVCALRKAGLRDSLARRGTGYALDMEVIWV